MGTLWVAGAPIQIFDLDGGATFPPEVMGVYMPGPPPSIGLRLSDARPRALRSVIHEMLHHIDVTRRLDLTHDQIRALSSGLDVTLRDRRNVPTFRGSGRKPFYLSGHPMTIGEYTHIPSDRIRMRAGGDIRFSNLGSITSVLNDMHRWGLKPLQIIHVARDLRRTFVDERNSTNKNSLAYLLP